MKETSPPPNDGQKLELKDQLKQILEEARMVLPGIQALFGFQLIAVMNEAFGKKLDSVEQHVHLLAIAFTAVACGLCMAPAAYHRISEPDRVSKGLVICSTRYLSWGMKTLGIAIVLDFYLVSRIVLKDTTEALVVAGLLFAFLLSVWVILPRVRREKKRAERHRESEAGQPVGISGSTVPRSSNT